LVLLIILKIIFLKSENLKKLLGKENTKIGETQELLASSYSTITKQVSNN
jgi:hypothetical protein